MESLNISMKEVVYTEKMSEDFLKKHLPIVPNVFTMNVSKAIKFSKNYPIVLKLISPGVLHKSDIGAVKFVDNEEELKKAFHDLLILGKRKRVHVDGILVQEMKEGQQLIIGVKKDPTFGQTILVGLGGIFVEVFKDVSIRICPISLLDAREMINELKAIELLRGARGEKGINFKVLEEALVSVSKLAVKHDIKELDINPFVVNSKEGFVADARIVF